MPHTCASIGCTVTECKHHAKSAQLCNLNYIQVGKSKVNADCKECTECDSFEKG